ncbi:MAG: hypothetical protein IJG41_01925, partial [Bacteroidales bacterium]|nr:hypothetical protein [Bacteroidales bacterium]
MIPIVLRETNTSLKTSTIPDSKRQQTTTVDYKRLINGFVWADGVSLQRDNFLNHGKLISKKPTRVCRNESSIHQTTFQDSDQ